MRVETYTAVYKGEFDKRTVCINQSLGHAEIELPPILYNIIGDAENPNRLFAYPGGGKYREVADLETIFRSILMCPPPKKRGDLDPFSGRVRELQPVMAAYRKAKALAARFIEHWSKAENAEEIELELRRRYEFSKRVAESDGFPMHHDDMVQIGSWLGAKRTGIPKIGQISDLPGGF